MKIKSHTLYILMIYTMLCAYMLGPMLSFTVGIPRIDNPMSLLFVCATLFIAFFEDKRFPKKMAVALFFLSLMVAWSALHLVISPLTNTQFADLMFFLVVPCFFYLLYLCISRVGDPLVFIQCLTAVFTLFISLPPLVEVATGIQFVNTSGEELSIEAGAAKGLFFNPNNMATTAVCLAPAVLIFFNYLGRTAKEKSAGWILFALLGAVTFVSASRTAIACYLALLALHFIYRKNGLTTLLSIAAAYLLFAATPSHIIQNFLLSLTGNPFLERFSSRLYLFLYDFGSDNSVSYRQEIYNYFLEHPPLLYTGYGPKNFGEYFGGHLSHSLGFENPHSFIIELYLGFGMISLLAFLGYAATYFANIASAKLITGKTRFFALIGMAIFLLGGFIPSSILRLPFLWLPCFLIFIYIMYIHQNNRTYMSGFTPID